MLVLQLGVLVLELKPLSMLTSTLPTTETYLKTLVMVFLLFKRNFKLKCVLIIFFSPSSLSRSFSPLPQHLTLSFFWETKTQYKNKIPQNHVQKKKSKQNKSKAPNCNQIKEQKRIWSSLHAGQLLVSIKPVLEWFIYPVSLYGEKWFSLSQAGINDSSFVDLYPLL